MRFNQLYIWGPNPLNNRLFADHIKSLSDAKPVCISESSELTERAIDPGSLFFCDCGKGDARSYCRKIHRNGFSLKETPSIVLFNVQRDEDLLDVITTFSIQGVFYHSDRFELFEKGIRKVLDGEYWLSRDLLVKSLHAIREDQCKRIDPTVPTLLTIREREILKLITAGLSNQAIAERLYISPNTVKTHISNIYKKIDSSNRVQAIVWATEFLHFSPMPASLNFSSLQLPAREDSPSKGD